MGEHRKRMPQPTTVADLLASIFSGTPTEKRLQEGKIWLVWDEVVGPQIAARARPARFSSGVLTVVVATAPWMQQLNFLKASIQEKLNAALGRQMVTEIYLKAGTLKRQEPEAEPTPSPPALSPNETEAIAERTAVIADPDLRRAFIEIMVKNETLDRKKLGPGTGD